MGELEQLVLLALIRLDGEAYGMEVRREIEERTGRDLSIGAIYTTLDRLERKGHLGSRLGQPTAERGGKAKKHYRILASGRRAVRDARRALDRMWEGVAGAGPPESR
jgi:PadR family transcriptional regulator, regulatory protein PadR